MSFLVGTASGALVAGGVRRNCLARDNFAYVVLGVLRAFRNDDNEVSSVSLHNVHYVAYQNVRTQQHQAELVQHTLFCNSF